MNQEESLFFNRFCSSPTFFTPTLIRRSLFPPPAHPPSLPLSPLQVFPSQSSLILTQKVKKVSVCPEHVLPCPRSHKSHIHSTLNETCRRAAGSDFSYHLVTLHHLRPDPPCSLLISPASVWRMQSHAAPAGPGPCPLWTWQAAL